MTSLVQRRIVVAEMSSMPAGSAAALAVAQRRKHKHHDPASQSARESIASRRRATRLR